MRSFEEKKPGKKPDKNMKISRNPGYDAVSDVVESGGLWRSDFQIGSRVLKKVL